MANPLTKQEQQRETYFVPDKKLIVTFAMSCYDQVSVIDAKGKTVKAMENLPDAKSDSASLKAVLDKYGFSDTGPEDIYTIDEDPSYEKIQSVIFSIKRRISENPAQNYMIIFILVGHGMQIGSK